MNSTCPHCGQDFEIEPGFYIGAMYVSYAFTVAVLFVVGVFLYFFTGDPPVWVYAVTTLVLIILLYPLIFRYSRIIYLHLFGGIRYRPDDK